MRIIAGVERTRTEAKVLLAKLGAEARGEFDSDAEETLLKSLERGMLGYDSDARQFKVILKTPLKAQGRLIESLTITPPPGRLKQYSERVDEQARRIIAVMNGLPEDALSQIEDFDLVMCTLAFFVLARKEGLA